MKVGKERTQSKMETLSLSGHTELTSVLYNLMESNTNGWDGKMNEEKIRGDEG